MSQLCLSTTSEPTVATPTLPNLSNNNPNSNYLDLKNIFQNDSNQQIIRNLNSKLDSSQTVFSSYHRIAQNSTEKNIENYNNVLIEKNFENFCENDFFNSNKAITSNTSSDSFCSLNLSLISNKKFNHVDLMELNLENFENCFDYDDVNSTCTPLSQQTAPSSSPNLQTIPSNSKIDNNFIKGIGTPSPKTLTG